MLIFLARHGESIAKQLGDRQNPDTPLSPKGELQAEILAEKIVNKKIDLLISSRYKRTIQTARIISEKIKKPIKITNLLCDQKKDLLSKAKIGSPVDLNYKNSLKKHWGDFNWKFNDKGESLSEVVERVSKFRTFLEKKYHNENILIVTHEIIISCFIASSIFKNEILSENSKSFIVNFKSEYCGLLLLEFNNGKWHQVY